MREDRWEEEGGSKRRTRMKQEGRSFSTTTGTLGDLSTLLLSTPRTNKLPPSTSLPSLPPTRPRPSFLARTRPLPPPRPTPLPRAISRDPDHLLLLSLPSDLVHHLQTSPTSFGALPRRQTRPRRRQQLDPTSPSRPPLFPPRLGLPPPPTRRRRLQKGRSPVIDPRRATLDLGTRDRRCSFSKGGTSPSTSGSIVRLSLPSSLNNQLERTTRRLSLLLTFYRGRVPSDSSSPELHSLQPSFALRVPLLLDGNSSKTARPPTSSLVVVRIGKQELDGHDVSHWVLRVWDEEEAVVGFSSRRTSSLFPFFASPGS